MNDIIAVGSGVYFLYAGWKNNYLSKKDLKQKEVLQANKLINKVRVVKMAALFLLEVQAC
ncbi:hypothetical protein [Niallia nealsonii]|uniref:hypothetical protein n=1 Tax=Niallia nealsonii TaxID=115979 RepID=UPI002286F449|nr:hypothetical protein [Niallia nealsonii]